MARVKIQVFVAAGQPKVVWIDTDATAGAVLGANLTLSDGTLVRAEDVLNSYVKPAQLNSVDWNGITSKPSTFPPAAHTHAPASLTGFGVAGGYLRSDGTAWVRVAGVAWADLTGVPATFAPAAHSHGPADLTGLNGLPNAVDDAAAATAGVAVGNLYRDGSTIKVRVA